MKGNNYVRYISYTGLFLALTVVFQMLRVIFPMLSAVPILNSNLSSLIIGSLVNLTLLMAVWTVGFWSGAVISVLATLISFAQGHLPIPHMIVAVSAGNLVLSYLAYALRNNKIIAVITAAVLKPAVLFLLVTYIVVPVFTPGKDSTMGAALSVAFSWPQIVTAAVGGILALTLYNRTKKAI